NIVSANASREYAVFQLIEWAENHGRTEELLQAVRKERPTNPDIQAVADKLLPPDDADASAARTATPDGTHMSRVDPPPHRGEPAPAEERPVPEEVGGGGTLIPQPPPGRVEEPVGPIRARHRIPGWVWVAGALLALTLGAVVPFRPFRKGAPSPDPNKGGEV